MSLIVPATEYTSVSCFGWQVPKKKEPLPKKEQLPQSDNDVLAEFYERSDKDVAQYRYQGQEDFKNAEKRMGKSMPESELVRKVTAMNSSLFAEDSLGSKGCAAFYWKRAGEKIYTAANWRKGWIPEWTIMATDRADLPTRDGYRPGWRQVLQRLVKIGALKRKQVEEAFGYVTLNDLRGKNWHLNLTGF